MSAPTFPEAMPQVSLKHLLQALSLWATKASAEADLETIFGPRLNWPSAFKHLAAFRRADFSFLPAIHTRLAADMPGLWGGYSRDTREIYLSADCPQELLSAVLIEEIGHFLHVLEIGATIRQVPEVARVGAFGGLAITLLAAAVAFAWLARSDDAAEKSKSETKP